MRREETRMLGIVSQIVPKADSSSNIIPYLPIMLRVRIRNKAKTCNGVSYAPLSPDPQAGFSESGVELLGPCRRESSASSKWVGTSVQDIPKAKPELADRDNIENRSKIYWG